MTHLCINCNAPTVQRSGDEFTCEKCGYTWDVAHEQANAVYLASQGRPPAQPMADLEAASALDAALGLDQPPAEDPLIAALVKHNVPDIESLAEEAGVDLADARLKDEKIAALVTSGKVALDEHGDVIVKEE